MIIVVAVFVVVVVDPRNIPLLLLLFLLLIPQLRFRQFRVVSLLFNLAKVGAWAELVNQYNSKYTK